MRKNICHSMKAVVLFLVGSAMAVGPSMAYAQADSAPQIKVFVSILPQAYFVERVGGEGVEVQVMVGPGQSPATYEPDPRQMALLSQSDVYFTIDMPFERQLVRKLARFSNALGIVDTRTGIRLREMGNSGEHSDHDHGPTDPHIWLDPANVKILSANICTELVKLRPERKEQFETNLRDFEADLDALDSTIAQILLPFKGREFVIFHPVLGYLADRYDLVQTAIEVEGKEPSARYLAELIDKADRNEIKTIFVQPQFSTKSAEAIARAIVAELVRVDPLAKNYLSNMKDIAVKLAEGLKGK